jgi:hypothetical protein
MGADSMLNNLSPVVSQYDYDSYRVPLRKEGNSYTIYVADKFSRVFDEDTLPDEVKTKMAMILANPMQICKDYELTNLRLMQCPVEGVRSIGWRASDTMFIVILLYKTLCSLRGENIL